MCKERTIPIVLAEFNVMVPTASIRFLGNAGGFSGSRFWKVQTADGLMCLRRWPREHPSLERLKFIHQILYSVGNTECPLALPRIAISGDSFLPFLGYFWEFAEWLPGEANYDRAQTPAKLCAAMTALANFHHLARQRTEHARSGTSPGLAFRLQRLQELDQSIPRIIQSVVAQPEHPLSSLACEFLELCRPRMVECQKVLSSSANIRVQLQPCLRDIWHDHVLFVGERVTGIIDYGAMNIESTAADIARLLGSLTRDAPEKAVSAMDAYLQRNPIGLGERERSLLAAFDLSNLVLGGLNWLHWVYVEGRKFDDLERVRGRLDEIAMRLRKQSNPPNSGILL